jgi:aryl-alcohol dehydrogenase-like predicted oxidoreductase
MWGMGGWTGSNDEESMQALQRAVDLGCNFFDTAWAYGAGKSEGLLGELVRANPAGMTMPEMALRFILAEPTVTTIIPGMRKIKHVEDNLAASEAGPLEAALLKELEKHRWDRQPTVWSQ